MCDADAIVDDMLAPRVVMKADDLSALMKGVRPMLVRALTAQAWAVACALVGEMHRRQVLEADAPSSHVWSDVAHGMGVAARTVAALPAPADLIDTLYGSLP